MIDEIEMEVKSFINELATKHNLSYLTIDLKARKMGTAGTDGNNYPYYDVTVFDIGYRK